MSAYIFELMIYTSSLSENVGIMIGGLTIRLRAAQPDRHLGHSMCRPLRSISKRFEPYYAVLTECMITPTILVSISSHIGC